jgi:hypothetical protein
VVGHDEDALAVVVLIVLRNKPKYRLVLATLSFNVWTPSFKKSQQLSPKIEPFNHEMRLKMPLSSRGMELSNYKPGCKVSALHFFVKKIPPTAF